MSVSSSRISSPGLLFLVKSTPNFVLPLIGFHGAFVITEKYFRRVVPKPIRIICYVLSVPIYFVSRVLWSQIWNKVKAASLGLAEVPAVSGKLPGNLDVVREWEGMGKGTSYVGKRF